MKKDKNTALPETLGIVALLFLLFFPHYISIMLTRLHGDPVQTLYRGFIWFSLGLMLSALLLPRLLLFSRQRQPLNGEGARRVEPVFIGTLCVIAACTFFAIYNSDVFILSDASGTSRFASFMLGALLPLGQMLFFECVPPHWQGRSMGALFSLLELVWLMLLPDLKDALAPDVAPTPEELAFFLQGIRNVLFICMGGAACFALVLWRKYSKASAGSRSGLAPVPVQPPAYRSAFKPLALLVITVLCFLLGGLLNGGMSLAFMHFRPVSVGVYAMFCIVSPAAGLCLDIYGQRGARALVTGCACVFLLVPVLIVAREGSVLHSLLYHAAYTAQQVIFLVILLLLGRGPSEGRFPGLLGSSVYLVRWATFLSAALVQNTGRQSTELVLFSAMLLGGGIIITALRAPAVEAPHTRGENFPGQDEQVSVKASTEQGLLTPEELDMLWPVPERTDTPEARNFEPAHAPESEHAESEELAAGHRLTPAKQKVLHLLLEGGSTGEMAEALGIAPPLPGEGTMSADEFAVRYRLTPRMREVLHLLLEGASTQAIAENMSISQYTARLHVHRILRKAQLHSRKSILELVRKN